MEQTDTQNAVCNKTYHMNYLLTKTQKYNKTSSGSEINYTGYKSINRQKSNTTIYRNYDSIEERKTDHGQKASDRLHTRLAIPTTSYTIPQQQYA